MKKLHKTLLFKGISMIASSSFYLYANGMRLPNFSGILSAFSNKKIPEVPKIPPIEDKDEVLVIEVTPEVEEQTLENEDFNEEKLPEEVQKIIEKELEEIFKNNWKPSRGFA